MFNTEHWTICRQFSKVKFEEQISSFMVLGETRENLLIVTEDGNGYFYRKRQMSEPTLWNVSNIVDAAQGKTHALILNQEGKAYLYGGFILRTGVGLIEKNLETIYVPVLIPSPHRFISVKCGMWHCLALTKDGKVLAWGENKSYQVGLCDGYDLVYSPHLISELNHLHIVAIACGGSHSLALTDDGDVYSWGDNSNGQIGGINAKTMHFGPVDSCVCSEHRDYRPVKMETSCPIKAMAAGYSHTLLLTHGGQVYVCGGSRSGQLCCAIKNNSTFFNSKLEIVVGLPPICQIGSHFFDDIMIAISFDRSCFVWGIYSIEVPLRLSMSYSTIDSALSLFSSSSCLPNLTRVQETKLGQLSNCLARMFDNLETSDVQFVVQDKIIHAHRFILRNASHHFDQMFSKIWCSDHPKTKIVIADHSYLVFHAYLRFLYTDCLPDCFENITELLKLANSYQEVALQQKCCARLQSNNPGTVQIECGTTYWPVMQKLSADFLEKVRSFMVMGKQGDGVLMTTDNGDVYWFGTIWKKRYAATPTKLNVSNIIQMTHGNCHILMMNQQGQIFAFGSNDYGQLGWKVDQYDYNSSHIYSQPRLISSPYRFVSIQCGRDHSMALTEDGIVFAWGANLHCQLATRRCKSHPTLSRISKLCDFRVVQIACGDHHSLALIDDSTVFSWGYNKFNQLGHSVKDGKNVCSVPTRIEILFPIKSISGGRCYSFVLTQSGQLYLCFKFQIKHIWAALNDFDDVPDQRLAEINSSDHLQKIHNLPPISHIVSYFDAYESFAVTFNKSCYVLELMGCHLNAFICPTIDFALAFKSSYHNTPYSFQFEGPKTDFLLNCMTRMFDCSETSDIEFVVENKTIHVHRAILQNVSSYFERMFSKTWCLKIDNPIVKIIISDRSYSVFYAYLHFLYTDRLQVSLNDLTELFELACYYLEDRLQRLCLDRMWTNLSVKNCCHYYQLTDRYDSLFPQSFVRNLLQFISLRTRLIYSSDEYRALDQTEQQKLSFAIENYV